jgi:hypothetical protein
VTKATNLISIKNTLFIFLAVDSEVWGCGGIGGWMEGGVRGSDQGPQGVKWPSRMVYA